MDEHAAPTKKVRGKRVRGTKNDEFFQDVEDQKAQARYDRAQSLREPLPFDKSEATEIAERFVIQTIMGGCYLLGEPGHECGYACQAVGNKERLKAAEIWLKDVREQSDTGAQRALRKFEALLEAID